jgi:hypothetical protein
MYPHCMNNYVLFFYLFIWLGQDNPLKEMEVQARFSLLEAPMVMTRRAQMRPKLHLVPPPTTTTKCPARRICTAGTGSIVELHIMFRQLQTI